MKAEREFSFFLKRIPRGANRNLIVMRTEINGSQNKAPKTIDIWTNICRNYDLISSLS